MTPQKIKVMETLQKLKFKPKLENGRIAVMFEMKKLFFFIDEQKPDYVAIILPLIGIDESEIPLALEVCNKLTRDMESVKVYIDENNDGAYATCDFHYMNEESLVFQLDYAVRLLSNVRLNYLRYMEELRQASR